MCSTTKQFVFTVLAMEHLSYTRLMEVLKSLGAITNAADLARLLNISEQAVTNWKRRGIAKNVIIELSNKYNFSVKYVTNGELPKLISPTYTNENNDKKSTLKAEQSPGSYTHEWPFGTRVTPEEYKSLDEVQKEVIISRIITYVDENRIKSKSAGKQNKASN